MIRHILADGTETDSISGVVLLREKFASLYAILARSEKAIRDENEKNLKGNGE